MIITEFKRKDIDKLIERNLDGWGYEEMNEIGSNLNKVRRVLGWDELKLGEAQEIVVTMTLRCLQSLRDNKDLNEINWGTAGLNVFMWVDYDETLVANYYFELG